MFIFFFSSRRRHTRLQCDWSSDVCSSDLKVNNLIISVPISTTFPYFFNLSISVIFLDISIRIFPGIIFRKSLIFPSFTRSEERRVGKEYIKRLANALLKQQNETEVETHFG